jgi:hypothetical protein
LCRMVPDPTDQETGQRLAKRIRNGTDKAP